MKAFDAARDVDRRQRVTDGVPVGKRKDFSKQIRTRAAWILGYSIKSVKGQAVAPYKHLEEIHASQIIRF
ncbi:MAG: hypothetical protein ACK52S_19110 [Pirellula sp.]